MSFALLAPLGLAALAALALPPLIHLVRRLELTATEFAALRWIDPRSRPQRRLRFERPWLLLLRLALLALLALLLARLAWNGAAQPSRDLIVVAPGVSLSEARAAVNDAAADWRWLAPQFPPVGETPPAAAPIASLLRELDADLPGGAALHVVVPEQVAGLDGERPRLSREIDWHVVPGRMPADAAPPAAPIRLAVRYAPQNEGALRYLHATVAAWNLREPGRYTLDAQPADAPIPASTNWLVWLAPTSDEPARWLGHGGIALIAGHADAQGEPLWRDASGNVLARSAEEGHGRLIALSGAFAPEALPLLLDADFPERLRAAFAGPPPAPTRANATALRPRRDAVSSEGGVPASRTAQPLDGWLALLIAALFLLERFVATRPQTEAAP